MNEKKAPEREQELVKRIEDLEHKYINVLKELDLYNSIAKLSADIAKNALRAELNSIEELNKYTNESLATYDRIKSTI